MGLYPRRQLVFSERADISGPGTGSGRDRETGAIVWVSVGQKSAGGYERPARRAFEEGYCCGGNTESSEELPKLTPVPATKGPAAMTPLAVPGQPLLLEGVVLGHTENVYEYRRGQVYLISPADETSQLRNVLCLFGIDESGRDVFFTRTDSLVPQDTDTQSSWYDAREEGGFPAPALSAGCEGEACQEPTGAAPALVLCAMAGFERLLAIQRRRHERRRENGQGDTPLESGRGL